MRPLGWHAIGWIVIILTWIVWEIIGLYSRTDENQPFTWYVRKVAGHWTSPLWWLVLGFCLWMPVHFLFVHNR